jgi:hypothetical protein
MLTIAWDVDDVLNDLMRRWLESAWIPVHPRRPLRYEELTENPPHRLLGVELEEYLESLDDFRLASAGRLEPVLQVVDWFGRWGECFRHLAVTATPLRSAPLSAAWVMTHFGRWIRTFSFVPSPRRGEDVPSYDGQKADFLRWWGKADILVDDNPANIASAQGLGITGLLVPRPWNDGGSPLADQLDRLARAAVRGQ